MDTVSLYSTLPDDVTGGFLDVEGCVYPLLGDVSSITSLSFIIYEPDKEVIVVSVCCVYCDFIRRHEIP